MEFPRVEKHGMVSLDFIVKSEAAMSKTVKSAQVLHVEDEVLPVVVKGDESAPEKEQVSKFTEPNTIVIETVKGVTESPSPLAAACFLYKVGRVKRVVGQSLTVAPVSPLNFVTTGGIKTWYFTVRGVPLLCSTAVHTLGGVKWVGGSNSSRRRLIWISQSWTWKSTGRCLRSSS